MSDTTNIVTSLLDVVNEIAITRHLEVFSRSEMSSDDCVGFIDVAGKNNVGRITIWSTGECVSEVIDADSEVLKYHKVDHIISYDLIGGIVKTFIENID